MADKRLYLIAGCNGAGKTTMRESLLGRLHCHHWVSDDDIAYRLSPHAPEQAFVSAGRLMLERIEQLLAQGETFAIETTLAPRCFGRAVMQARQWGYEVNLLFFHLPSSQLAVSRVNQRVSRGGRYVPAHVVERHYHAGLRNLKQLYMPLVDRWNIYTLEGGGYRLLAEGKQGESLECKKISI